MILQEKLLLSFAILHRELPSALFTSRTNTVKCKFVLNALPASIEAYLEEAGFSSTEMLLLKQLLEHEALTLRQLAAKTGKSTGVLDQAMRKLLRKDIVMKKTFNGVSKFTITSLQSVVKWLGEDVKKKREMLLRRHQDFASFVSSIEHDKRRPGTEYFEGDEGLKRAYIRLLQYGKEMLQYLPMQPEAENDSLKEFHAQYYRERRGRKITARILAHNNPLGRRFKSRDPFEDRETILVPEEQYPFKFEKIIIGNAVACFHRTEKRACLIEYPELADMERALFEGIWQQGKQIVKDGKEAVSQPATASAALDLAKRKSLLEGLQDFFFSKRGLRSLAVCVVLSSIMTYGLYRYNLYLNIQRVRDKVMGIAATGALQFEAGELEELRVESDYQKPQWSKVVNKLKSIREQNENIYFVYIFRKSEGESNAYEFVADSHSINPYANTDTDLVNDIDVNRNGIIDGPDILQWPGQEYPTPPKEATEVNDMPLASSSVYEDQWGAFITGYAPIKNEVGHTVAVLAVDITAADLAELASRTFIPIACFIALLLIFISLRLLVFHRPLLKQMLHGSTSKKAI